MMVLESLSSDHARGKTSQLGRTSSRDQAAFCEANYEHLVRALSLYCGDVGVAEDLAQEALIRACRDWHQLRRHPSPEGWLCRVAFNLANSHFRRKRAEWRAKERLKSFRGEMPSDVDPLSALVVRSAVAKLPRRQRTALVLRYFADLPIANVASLMECSEGTVKSLTNRAVETMRRQLQSANPKEDY